jgi:DNA-directed RNA polymerase subunit alpha
MQNIALPKKIEFKAGNSSSEGQIIVEPLYSGYGMTLGNSLRRVLLSSLPGAAVIGVKIKGVSHEFMALPGLKEDILEVILNLKQLRLKMFTEEEVTLVLKAKGSGEVTAAAISKNSDVEIKNPELVIANLTEANASIEMEILVKEGRGYKMSEGGKRDNELGYIEIDSIFSPVLSVSIDVESARVGKMTNWDKLVLNIKTDETITPQEAFEQSVKILVDQFSALLPNALIAPAPAAEEVIEEVLPNEEEVVETEEVVKPTKKKAKK